MRFWLFPIAALLVLAAGVGLNLYSFNQFSALDPVALARCEPVTGIAGPEDIEIDAGHARAFISSLDRRADAARGAIHVFDLEDPLAAAGFRDRTAGAPEAFRPLGLDYYEDGEVRRLFVVNEAGPAIELFDVGDDGELTHLDTFAERRLTSPNNIAATGPRSFYVSNDVRGGRTGFVANLAFLMRLGSGEVFYIDDAKWTLAADGLRFANGLALSPDRSTLYVAETAGKTVRVYDRDAATGALALADKISIDASPDNINVDANGDLWVGALPRPLAVPPLLNDARAKAPSEVIRISPDGKATTIYRNDGAEHSAATVAARLKNKLLIGALYERKFLFCELPASAD